MATGFVRISIKCVDPANPTDAERNRAITVSDLGRSAKSAFAPQGQYISGNGINPAVPNPQQRTGAIYCDIGTPCVITGEELAAATFSLRDQLAAMITAAVIDVTTYATVGGVGTGLTAAQVRAYT